MIDRDWLLSLDFQERSLSWQGQGHEGELAYVCGRVGVKRGEIDDEWCAYMINADEFDGSEDYLVSLACREDLLAVFKALKIDLNMEP